MATIFRIVFLLLAATWPAFALSEQHADETFDVTAGAKLVVDVDFGTIDVTHGPRREGLQGTINGGGKSMVLRTGAGPIAIRSTSPAR